jgi:hypothetical protein
MEKQLKDIENVDRSIIHQQQQMIAVLVDEEYARQYIRIQNHPKKLQKKVMGQSQKTCPKGTLIKGNQLRLALHYKSGCTFYYHYV